MWSEQKNKVTCVFLCLFIHFQLCLNGSMMQTIAWMARCHEILKKAHIVLSLGTMVLRHGVYREFCVFGLLLFNETALWFYLCLMQGLATLVLVWYYCWFIIIFFLFSSCLAFYMLSLGNWLGKRKVCGARRELKET